MFLVIISFIGDNLIPLDSKSVIINKFVVPKGPEGGKSVIKSINKSFYTFAATGKGYNRPYFRSLYALVLV